MLSRWLMANTAADWNPTSLSGGWWLSHDYGIATGVTTWASRGTLSPAFTARTGSTVSKDYDGVYFPGGNADFLYESTPVAKTNDHTVFGVFRPKQEFSTNGVIIGRYKTSTSQRAWQVALDSLNSRQISTHSPDGSTTSTTAVSPTGRIKNRWYAFVMRKNGTAIKTYFRKAVVVDGTVGSATINDPPLPTTIGSRGGDASTDGSIGFNGWIRHLGFYNRALSDGELSLLLDWLQVQEQQLVRGSVFNLTDSGYTALSGTHVTVIAPNGATPVSGTPATHRYRHHVALGEIGGRVWLSHSSGEANEDASGQQVHVCSSADLGDTWSSPTVVVPTIGSFGGASYVAGTHIGFSRCFVTHEAKLYCVAAVDRVGTIGGSSSVLTGAALVACECKADGTTGPVFRIENTGPGYSGAPSYNGTLGPPIYALANPRGIWGGNAPNADGDGGPWFGWVTLRDESGTVLTEMSSIRLPSGHYCRTLRCVSSAVDSNETKLLWTSTSIDDGATWSSPTPSDVPNYPSSAKIGMLSGGRVAVFGNPQDAVTVRGTLAMYLFDTARNAVGAYSIRSGLGDTPVYSGTYKSGGPAYPGFAQVGNQLIVGYSVWKERIDVTRFTVP